MGFILLLSCSNKTRLKPQVSDCIVVKKLKDTIIIDGNYPDTLIKGSDSMYYDMGGELELFTLHDTVLYINEVGASYRVIAIRKEDDGDLFRTSYYLYFSTSKEFVLKKQILYNSEFEIISIKEISPIKYIK